MDENDPDEEATAAMASREVHKTSQNITVNWRGTRIQLYSLPDRQYSHRDIMKHPDHREKASQVMTD